MTLKLALLPTLVLTALGHACGGSSGPTAPVFPPGVGNFNGRWVGTASVTGCSDTAAVRDQLRLCEAFRIGTAVPVTMTLHQGGTTVSGVATFSWAGMSVLGESAPDGVLRMRGDGYSSDDFDTEMAVSLNQWGTSLSDRVMRGSFDLAWASLDGEGSGVLALAVDGVTRTD